MTDRIRPARPDEAAALTDLAMRSKAHWGYDDAFMAACRAELTVSAEAICSGTVFVYEEAGLVLGLYWLEVREDNAEVEQFFVEPGAIGRGVGRALWRHMCNEARRRGARKIRIESDPDAEDFYRKMGARRVGTAPSGSIPDRMLPLLELRL